MAGVQADVLYYGHIGDELVSRVLKEKSLSGSVKGIVNDIEGLQEIWDTLDTCFDRPEKHILEALNPIVKFKKYRALGSRAVRELYSLLRSAMLWTRKLGLLHHLVNNQTLPSILARMPMGD
jgi:hypothetical protein